MSSVFVVDVLKSDIQEDTRKGHADVAPSPPSISFCRRYWLLISVILVSVLVTICFAVAYILLYQLDSSFPVAFRDHSADSADGDGTPVTWETANSDKNTDVRLYGNNTVIYDYSHFLKVLHFGDLQHVCFVTELNTLRDEKITEEPNEQEILQAVAAEDILRTSTGDIVDLDLLPDIARTMCERTMWLDRVDHDKGVPSRPRRSDSENSA